MSDKHCPTKHELLAFVDVALSPERLRQVEQHLELCSPCARQVLRLSELVDDIAAPVGSAPLNVAEHVASVMKRLDEPAKAAHRSRFLVWGGAVAGVAAAAATMAMTLRVPEPETPGTFAARGGPAEHTLARDVGVRLYVLAPSPQALESGGRLRADAPLTAGLRNAGSAPAYLLLFAVDSRNAVHWIAPRFTDPGTNPVATLIVPSPEEQLLESSAVFDDLAPGPVKVVSLISREPTRVSQIESLSADLLSATDLTKRFPRAEIREFMFEAVR